MSVEATSWAYGLNDPEADITPKLGQRLVLLVLADHAGSNEHYGDQHVCWPSVDRIAKHAVLSRRQVQRALKDLAEKRLIFEVGEGTNGTRVWALDLDGRGVKLSPPDRGVTSAGGDISGASTVTPMSPEPSVEPSGEETPSSSSTTTSEPAEPPAPPHIPADPPAEAIAEQFDEDQPLIRPLCGAEDPTREGVTCQLGAGHDQPHAAAGQGWFDGGDRASDEGAARKMERYKPDVGKTEGERKAGHFVLRLAQLMRFNNPEVKLPVGFLFAKDLPEGAAPPLGTPEHVPIGLDYGDTRLRPWLDVFRLIFDADERDPVEAWHVLAWCQGDDFWRTNILSPAKFRTQYDQLKLKSEPARRAAAAPAQTQQAPRPSQSERLMQHREDPDATRAGGPPPPPPAVR